MLVKRLMGWTLVGLLLPPVVPAADSTALLTGTVTSADGSPLAQLDFDLINLDNGKVVSVRTDGVGAFRTSLEPGNYTVDPGRSGYRVARGPRMVSMPTGQAVGVELVMERNPDVALLPPATRSGGFFGSKVGIITLSAVGVGAIATVVVLTRNNASPSR